MARFQRLDLTGQRFGKLFVLRFEKVQDNYTFWLCRCDCGREKVICGKQMTFGGSLSCGHCVRSYPHSHGFFVGGKIPPGYGSWSGMRSRCLNPKNPGFKWYGGRGIDVCKRWQGPDGFANFFADMGPPPPGTSLDRRNPDGNYEPSNCRWATPEIQANNKSDSGEDIEVFRDEDEMGW